MFKGELAFGQGFSSLQMVTAVAELERKLEGLALGAGGRARQEVNIKQDSCGLWPKSRAVLPKLV